ncbi:MAG: Rrf2 family transcriptional regulator [bacterium]|nr:Rrf2 family transcriptional regulator [bacterium]
MISISSKYALRALCYIASHPEDVPLTGGELAEQTKVPPNYLDKILQALRNRNILSASRGTGGGYWMRKTPEVTTLMEVVSVFEQIETKPFCLLWVNEPCSGDNPCSAHPSWVDIHNQISDFLKGTTIADIAYKKPGGKSISGNE